jgi:hypothetical protein
MENNLIYDYCISNPVTIRFWTSSDLDMLNALFDRPKEPIYLWKSGAYVSYYRRKIGENGTLLSHIGPYPDFGYTVLSIEEFFTLALPNKSILESIK